MTTPAPSRGLELTEPLRDLNAWATRFQRAPIPVLRDTADALEALRANEDNTDANSIGEMISGDPLMTLKVLAYESGHRGRSVVTSAETVISALVMMGISPFFRAFGPQTDRSRTGSRVRPEALAGLQARAAAGPSRRRLRARPSRSIAPIPTLPSSTPPPCCTNSPSCCSGATRRVSPLRIQAMQDADPELRSSVAQRAVLQYRARRAATQPGRSVAACRP